MGINQRVSLRKFIDDIQRWVEEDRSDDWIASALGTSPSSVQSFRSRNAIYRRHATTSTLYDPKDYSSYEGVLEHKALASGSIPKSATTRAGRNAGRAPRGRTAHHADQDRLAEARGQGPGGAPLASVSARFDALHKTTCCIRPGLCIMLDTN